MGYTVYIISSIEGYHYTGQTSNLERRLFEHNNQLSHSTKHGHNWREIWLKQSDPTEIGKAAPYLWRGKLMP